eukprot:scaffold302346_cov32-Tisochrysis_lutea.AAC.3
MPTPAAPICTAPSRPMFSHERAASEGSAIAPSSRSSERRTSAGGKRLGASAWLSICVAALARTAGRAAPCSASAG